jgi:transposase-like protein
MKKVLHRFVCRHFPWVLLYRFLRHGAPMKQAIDLCELIERFGSETKCREYLEGLRWPHCLHCPKCQSDKISRVYDRNQFDCDSCRYQFSVTSGTIFHDTHLPLWKWFLATYLICESRKGMSANQIKRVLGISYKTAWYLCHRIRAAMKAVGPQPQLDGTIEVDETYVGGKFPSRTRRHENKSIVIGIRQRGGELRMFHAKDVKSGTLAKYIRENVNAKDVDVIVTDEWAAYPKAMIQAGVHGTKHETVNHKSKEYVRGDIYTNTVESAFSLLKRGIIGTWHKVSAKHLQAYLDEMCWRFDNRKNQFLFRDTLIKMLEAENVEYKELTAETAA